MLRAMKSKYKKNISPYLTLPHIKRDNIWMCLLLRMQKKSPQEFTAQLQELLSYLKTSKISVISKYNFKINRSFKIHHSPSEISFWMFINLGTTLQSDVDVRDVHGGARGRGAGLVAAGRRARPALSGGLHCLRGLHCRSVMTCGIYSVQHH